MAFYKLFRVLHRRTDWYRLYEWQRKIMMPEWYEKQEKRQVEALAKLMIPFMACQNIMKNE